MKWLPCDRLAFHGHAISAGVAGVLVIGTILGSAPAFACSEPPPVLSGVTAAGQSPDPRAVQSSKIHEDSPEAREEVLRRRPVADGTKVPSEVAPLPGQTISPPASPGR
jgi:hypothetical protein